MHFIVLETIEILRNLTYIDKRIANIIEKSKWRLVSPTVVRVTGRVLYV